MRAAAIILIFYSFLIQNQLIGQCTISQPGGNYDVNVAFTLAGIQFKNSCSNPSGYNYDVIIDYNISITGSSPPASMYTLQGYLNCYTHSNFGLYFNLPNNGGIGTTTTNGNPWVGNAAGCGSDTPTSLGCDQITLQINGPGIANQNVNCPPVVIALPITLNYFAAKSIDNKVLLEWETESEINSNYFFIEKSYDGINWDFLGKVIGAGNSSSPRLYNLEDSELFGDEIFYRMRQFDFDGKASVYFYSNIIKIVDAETSVFPNPVESILTIKNHQNGAIQITDVLGKIVTPSTSTHSNGNDLYIDMSHLESGCYFVFDGSTSHQIIKR